VPEDLRALIGDEKPAGKTTAAEPVVIGGKE
jgi:hypothetical protein